MKTLREEYERWKRATMPADAPMVQRIEMKRAFYSGALCMFALVAQTSEDAVTEEAGAQYLETLRREAKDFFKQVGVSE